MLGRRQAAGGRRGACKLVGFVLCAAPWGKAPNTFENRIAVQTESTARQTVTNVLTRMCTQRNLSRLLV